MHKDVRAHRLCWRRRPHRRAKTAMPWTGRLRVQFETGGCMKRGDAGGALIVEM